MDKTYNSRDARTNWRDVLDLVQGGGSVTVTRSGRVVARIVPVAAPATLPKLGDRWGDLTLEQRAWVPVGAKVNYPTHFDCGFVKVAPDEWLDGHPGEPFTVSDEELVPYRIITHIPTDRK